MHSQPAATDSGFDFKELFARLEYDPDLLRDVFQIYMQEYPRLYLLLQNSVSRGELKQVEIHAHTLKGMLASLSFSSASHSAMRIERMAQIGRASCRERV